MTGEEAADVSACQALCASISPGGPRKMLFAEKSLVALSENTGIPHNIASGGKKT